MDKQALLELVDSVQSADKSACKKLSLLVGYKVILDGDGEYRFYRFGHEFFCMRPEQVAAALRAIAGETE